MSVVFGMTVMVRVKPTEHPQSCVVCRKIFKKGDIQILVQSASFGHLNYQYYHYSCIRKYIKQLYDTVKEGLLVC